MFWKMSMNHYTLVFKYISIYYLTVIFKLLCIINEISFQITGAGHGIGKELALQFASLGATVVCWDINRESNEGTVKEIAAAGSPKAYAYEYV